VSSVGDERLTIILARFPLASNVPIRVFSFGRSLFRLMKHGLTLVVPSFDFET